MSFSNDYSDYLKKQVCYFNYHGISIEQSAIRFSNSALTLAEYGDWSAAATELRDFLQTALSSQLSSWHRFVDVPYVRRMELPGHGSISMAIINEQSRDWYGTERTIGSFDFLLEAKRGVFQGCKSFLDLGGHQLIWSCFYAMTDSGARVVAYEPSILNVAIGLFNCFVNGVIGRVDVVPYAVLASNAPDDVGDAKMLVDFMTTPLRGQKIGDYPEKQFDFIKTDIEGYEFELLSDPIYVGLMRNSKSSHLELHLGHLFRHGVTVDQWISRLREAKISGSELYSGVEMYQFLSQCDPQGFYSFIVSVE